ncbi:unnamed protein product [Notodromas monacha]|uniref:Calpain catalytic domain-containing protein n=1 Tax=Notodromas monacha TaxID=399045 RepID=A0A7R9GC73_9CRUS|nr:unnamed protein product [Notodromas monacha]CAG0915683.1 unnamed protein product [Notodromas monacha]
MSGAMSLEDAADYAFAAVKFDETGNFDAAIFYYRAAAETLDTFGKDGGVLSAEWEQKRSSYVDRLNLLLHSRDERNVSGDNVAKAQKSGPSSRAKFLLSQALDADEAGAVDTALELYTDAVQQCIEAKKQCSDQSQANELQKLALQALERAEVLKGIPVAKDAAPPQSTAPVDSKPKIPSYMVGRVVPPLGIGTIRPDVQPQHVSVATRSVAMNKSDQFYSDDEISVLKHGSRINKRDYLPFMSIDLRERFAFPLPFTDKDGFLSLSKKQKSVFSRWARIEELSPEPKMVDGDVDCLSIRQTVVSDCSFVASLAVGALYEIKFPGKRIITGTLFPQNSKGQPVYNPCGKYMVKLHINGISRKVIVDDFLPVSARGDLLCSYSSNKNEFWISILEKAYMKVMGGYDFPGSNSSIDLGALTGWIPERVSIGPETEPMAFFEKLSKHMRRGDILVTLATGNLPQHEADRAGLVPTHAYAVLDVKDVLGTKLLMLKNPWAQLRWKGNYSELDRNHWTPALKAALKYDPHSAKTFDNGVFWIDYASVLKYFDVFYLSWNPSIFSNTYCIHRTWNAGVGPAKDLYTIGFNPQFRLEVKGSAKSVWVLLSRHITEIDDFKDNKEYITLLVYKSDGKKIYYPHEPPPYMDGVRINSPHYLCKIDLTDETRLFTLVVSQYEKSTTIHYTLRAFAKCPILIAPILDPFKYLKEERSGQWKGRTAGGCQNHRETYHNNPTYQINLESTPAETLIELRGPKQFAVGFEVISVSVSKDAPEFLRKNSGAFRSGYTVLHLTNMRASTYNIIPATYSPGEEGPFFLTVRSTQPLTLSRL